MTRAAAVLAAASVAAVSAQAQRPTVSPWLSDAQVRDTVVTVWLMARSQYALADVEAEIVAAGGRPRRRSRWLHAVSADLPTAALEVATTSRLLRRIQPVATFVGRRPYVDAPVRMLVGPPAPLAIDTLYGPSAMPLRRVNLFPLVERGLSGTGVRIAVLDTGFETGHPAFAGASVVDQWDFVFNDATVSNEPADAPGASRHGTAVWSLLAANLPNQIVGIAPDAEYILAKTEDVRSETRVEEDNYVAALEWADSLGAHIVASSLSYLEFDNGFAYSFAQLDGDVAVTTVAADSAAARGILVVTAAGNSGPQFRTVQTPADGDSVLAIGAEDSLGVLLSFSARGPTADGRSKPDLVAPGAAVFAVDVDPASPSGFGRFNGTSFSTPIVAGAAALLRELHPSFAAVDLIEALRGAGHNRLRPDTSVGWGRPDALVAGTFPRGVVVQAPGDTVLQTVTPRFAWSVPDAPAFALPFSYRLRVATDSSFTGVLLDTTLTAEVVQLDTAYAPGTRFVFEITATSADTVSYRRPGLYEYHVPPWATLITLNDSAGATIRERRPTFRWASPDAVSPPGPFLYDVAVLRVDNSLAAAEATGLSETSFTPGTDLELNTPYRWQVVARLGEDSAVVDSRSTFVIVDESVPTATLLFQNFPNPFPNRATGVTATCIWFDLAQEGAVRLDVLDVRGHVVRNLVPGDRFPNVLPAGRYGRGLLGATGRCDPNLEWDGTTSDGRLVPRGIYPVRLQTPQGTFVKRVVFLGREY